jgi:hypothetical protein
VGSIATATRRAAKSKVASAALFACRVLGPITMLAGVAGSAAPFDPAGPIFSATSTAAPGSAPGIQASRLAQGGLSAGGSELSGLIPANGGLSEDLIFGPPLADSPQGVPSSFRPPEGLPVKLPVTPIPEPSSLLLLASALAALALVRGRNHVL